MPHRGEFRLSWVSLEQLEADWDALDPVGRKRARHVLSENERVRQGVEALKAGDVAAFGRLMSASHASSRDDFENSSPALDALIEAAEAAPGFLGGKLSGAGWAGCTVNLVRADRAGDFAEAVRTRYARETGITPDIHVCRAADGAFGQDLAGAAKGQRSPTLRRQRCPGPSCWRTSSSSFHATYFSFVVFGLVLILLGIVFRWDWVRNFWFRSLHLAAIGIVVLEAFVGMNCPLTDWEQRLRHTGRGGRATRATSSATGRIG